MLRKYKIAISSHNLNSIKKIETCLEVLGCVNKKVNLPKKKKSIYIIKITSCK